MTVGFFEAKRFANSPTANAKREGADEKVMQIGKYSMLPGAFLRTRRVRKNCRSAIKHPASTLIRLIVQSERLILHAPGVFHRSFEVFQRVEFHQFLALEICKHVNTPEGRLE